jgi:lysophospholipase L1-like esterase
MTVGLILDAALIALMAACSPTAAAPAPNSADEAPMRYLALGDSYTIGESVSTDERWPMQLAALLREQGVETGKPQVIARTGWTTDELSAAMDRATLTGPFDMVSLLIGVNNQYRGRSQDEYRQQFVELLERAIGLAGGDPGRVLVLSIPDWGVTPFAINQNRAAIGSDIDAFNRINAEETQRLGAHYVDITPESREAADNEAMIAGDGLHPSGKMYADWAQLALPAAREALSARG